MASLVEENIPVTENAARMDQTLAPNMSIEHEKLVIVGKGRRLRL